MKILHTSDWHLGHRICGRQRHEEQKTSLDWLACKIKEERVDVLIVSGDIFDSSVPSNRSQKLYFDFLGTVGKYCRAIVIIAGNHDSPSGLKASSAAVENLNVHIVAAADDDVIEEVIHVKDKNGKPVLSICAVPYLSEQRVCRAEAGDTPEMHEEKLVKAILDRYAEMETVMMEARDAMKAAPPIVATGHLFAAGGKTEESGIRNLYVGTLGQVPVNEMPKHFSYLALGHLHTAQKAGGKENFRYSGSLLPISMKEAGQKKQVLLVTFPDQDYSQLPLDAVPVPEIREIEVPVFQHMKQIRSADLEDIKAQMLQLSKEDVSYWLEIVYEGTEAPAVLRGEIASAAAGTKLEVLSTRVLRPADPSAAGSIEGETLQDLDADEVFSRCLDFRKVPESERPGLEESYREVLAAVLAGSKEE